MNAIELAETAAWLDALYGKCAPDDGELVFVSRCKRKVEAACTLGSGDALVAAAKAVNGKPGLYLKINPMDADAMRERSRRDGKGRYITGKACEVKTIVSLHLDVDAGKSDQYLSRSDALKALSRMPCEPTLIVNSDGDAGGFHAYWILQQPHRIQDDADRKQIQSLAVRWQDRLNLLTDGKLDSTANIDRVLRVVGGTRTNGNRVTCQEYHPGRLYTLGQLTLPPSAQEIIESATRFVRKLFSDKLGPCEPSDNPISAYVDAANITVESLLSDHGYKTVRGKPKEWIRPESSTGSRSLKIATDNDRPGVNLFSAGDPNFDCLKSDGSVGRFYSIDAMFVILRHGGDWTAAAKWCHQQIRNQSQKNQPVDLSRIAS